MAELDAFAARSANRLVIKTARGGYDGRGVLLARDLDEARDFAGRNLAEGVPVLVEERVAMRRELAALVARSPFGQGAAWPVVETVQRDGICVEVIAPAPGLDGETAQRGRAAGAAAGRRTGRGRACWRSSCSRPSTVTLMVNELAMRPHNSGHWTMDGARTSQFEQHLRAVLDYPLGDTGPIAPVTVMANVLGAAEKPAMSMDERLHHLFGRIPDAKVHLYGKEERPGRKIGHVNVLGEAGGSARTSSTWRSFVNGRRGRHTGCRTRSGPTDGTDMAEAMSARAKSMCPAPGSD